MKRFGERPMRSKLVLLLLVFSYLRAIKLHDVIYLVPRSEFTCWSSRSYSVPYLLFPFCISPLWAWCVVRSGRVLHQFMLRANLLWYCEILLWGITSTTGSKYSVLEVGGDSLPPLRGDFILIFFLGEGSTFNYRCKYDTQVQVASTWVSERRSS